MGYDIPPSEGGMLGRSLSRRDSRGLNSDVQLTRSDSLHRQVKEKPRGVAIHGNDLLVCFAPRTSLSLVARPSLSPARGGGSGGAGGGGSSRGPSAFSNSTGKKLCAPIEEPSSPKVTCIGQVRNRHSHSGKNRRNPGNNSSPKRWFGGGGSKKEGGSSACSRFGKDFSCFGNCDSPAKMPSCGREGKTCGAFFAKSLLLLQQTDTVGKEKQGAATIASTVSDSSPQGVVAGDASSADQIPEKEPAAMVTMEEEEEEESNTFDCIPNPILTSTSTPTANHNPNFISPSNSAPSPSFTSSPNPSNSVPNPSLSSSPNPSFTSSPNPSFNSAPNPNPNPSFTSSPKTVPNPSLISTPHPSFTSLLNPSFTSSPNPSCTSPPNPSPNPSPSITSAPSPNSKLNPNPNPNPPSFVDKEDGEDDEIIWPPQNALLIMRQRASLLKRSRSAPSKTISIDGKEEAAEAEEEPETIARTEKSLIVNSKKTTVTKKKKPLIQTPYLKRSVSDSSNLHQTDRISARNSTSTKAGIAIDAFSSSYSAEMEHQQEPSPGILKSETSMMELSSGLCVREEDRNSSATSVIIDESNNRDDMEICNEDEGEGEGRCGYASSSSSLTSPENNTLPEEVLAEHPSPIIPHEALLILEYHLMDGLKVSVDATEAYLLQEEEENKSALSHALSPILQCQKLVNRKERGDNDSDKKQIFYEWKSRKSAEWPLQSAFQLPRCKSAPVRPASYA